MTADVIIHGGVVLTMTDDKPYAEAVALKGKAILKVGSKAEVMQLVGSGTLLVDARGGTVMPGFVECTCISLQCC